MKDYRQCMLTFKNAFLTYTNKDMTYTNKDIVTTFLMFVADITNHVYAWVHLIGLLYSRTVVD